MFGALWRWFWWSSGKGRSVTPPISEIECNFQHTFDLDLDFTREVVDFTCNFDHTLDMDLDYE